MNYNECCERYYVFSWQGDNEVSVAFETFSLQKSVIY